MLNSVSRLMKSGKSFRLPERRRKALAPATFGLTVTAVCAALAISGSSAAASYPVHQARVPTGNDISYPQWGKTLPSGQAFGIVAVNEGLPEQYESLPGGRNKLGPVFCRRHTAAEGLRCTSTPRTRAITASPTGRPVTPTPLFGNHDKDPYGTCRGGNSQACAWQYGWNMAGTGCANPRRPEPWPLPVVARCRDPQ